MGWETKYSSIVAFPQQGRNGRPEIRAAATSSRRQPALVGDPGPATAQLIASWPEPGGQVAGRPRQPRSDTLFFRLCTASFIQAPGSLVHHPPADPASLRLTGAALRLPYLPSRDPRALFSDQCLAPDCTAWRLPLHSTGWAWKWRAAPVSHVGGRGRWAIPEIRSGAQGARRARDVDVRRAAMRPLGRPLFGCPWNRVLPELHAALLQTSNRTQALSAASCSELSPGVAEGVATRRSAIRDPRSGGPEDI